MSTQYKDIWINYDQGNAEGYVVVSEAENFDNWAKDKGYSKEVIQEIKLKWNKISILITLYVEESERNKGFGNEILGDFLEESYSQGAEVVILEADTGERNEINLVEWYENWDFEIVDGKRDKYPMMLKNIN